MTPHLLATIGLPRSGKSTFCKSVYLNQGYAVVNPDSFRLAIHGQPFLESAERLVWASVFAAIDGLLLAGNNVIVDATNTSLMRRKPLVDRCVQFIVFTTPMEECVRRAAREGNDVLVSVIHRMARDWDDPAPHEHVLQTIAWEATQ